MRKISASRTAERFRVAAARTLGLFLMLILSSLLPTIAQEKTPVAAGDKAYPPQLAGTVVDPSGAVIAANLHGTKNDTVRNERLLYYFWTLGR